MPADAVFYQFPMSEMMRHLAGHADPRTTRLYERCQKQVTRNIVERISV
jgi:integrase/recombinase XerD